MAVEEDLPPEPRLMESMRSVGYSLEAALADLIDNSISARASSIDIFFETSPYDFVGILDDGHGMTAAGARIAMRLAGNSALETRSADDLGRFGLGLKTASLSQCRDLCVITIGADGLVGLRWNLDRLAESGRWAIQVLSAAEIDALPATDRLTAVGSGTLVLWQQLDVLRAQTGDDAGLDAAMVRTKEHLQLVFHRFLSGEADRPLTIRLNDVPLEMVDPFLQTHRATRVGPEESFVVQGVVVKVKPFTLPHLSMMRPSDKRKALIAGTLRDTQGFYVYRAKRLVIWGTWFRILPKEDLARLARVRVDLPNTLDHLWALDIKKSAAQPPPEVKQRLKRFADRMVEPSKRAHTYRGRQTRETATRVWNLVEDRDHFRYELNCGHPLITALSDQLDNAGQNSLARLLSVIASSYPIDDAFNRMTQDIRSDEFLRDETEYLQMARDLWAAYRDSNSKPDEFVSIMRLVEPFINLQDRDKILREAAQ